MEWALTHNKERLGSILFMIKPVSQGSPYVPPITLTTHGSILPVPVNHNVVVGSFHFLFFWLFALWALPASSQINRMEAYSFLLMAGLNGLLIASFS